jgi:manganese/zinc/iron transport system permease protein
LMMAGALIAGLLTAWLTERIGRSGWIRADAALGVVFTSFFALGLLLLRLLADRADLDLDCVLYGQLELVAVGAGALPSETMVCAAMLAVNVGLVGLLSKELLITTFDPQQAAALGFHPRRMHYGLMVVTTTTLVAAFEVVGSILVIGMLVVPAAAASFVTARLSTMLATAIGVALASAVMGHVAAITLPGPLTRAAGLPEVLDVKTSGAMILVSVAFLIAAMLFGPHRGYWSVRARP